MTSSVEQCALCADSTHDVHHAIVEVNVVIGVLVVHCELLVVRVVPVVVCDDAVVRRTLVLIAFIVAFVFVVAIFHWILLYWKYVVYMIFTIPFVKQMNRHTSISVRLLYVVILSMTSQCRTPSQMSQRI